MRFSRDAYAAWTVVEEESGEQLVIRTGSLVELVFDGKAESDVRVWTIGRDVLTTQDP